MKAVKRIILCLLVCGVFAGQAFAMEKGLSEENMVIADEAYVAIEKHKLAEAEKLIRIALKTQPNNYELHMMMVEVMEKRQNWKGVVQFTTAIIKANPNDGYAYASRGFALLNQEKTDQALKDLERAQKKGKLEPEMAKSVAAAIADIYVAKATGTTDEDAVVEVPSNYSTSEDLWNKAEQAKEDGHSDLALKYARASVKLLPDNRDRNLQMAYLALGYDLDGEAVTYFEKAIALQEPTLDESFMEADTFYAYKRLGEKKKSLYHLERVIDSTNKKLEKAGDKAEPKDIAENYYLRREHEDLTKQFGANTGIYYDKIRSKGYSLQGIQDIDWLPYNMNGRYVQLSVTGIETLKSDIYQYGSETLHAIVGISVDPLMDYNLSFGIDHVFKIGDTTQNDTRLRVAHSWDTGSELNPIASNWNYVTVYQEYLYAMQHSYSVYTGELRGGRSFKVGGLGSRFVVSPHVFAEANYNSLNSTIMIGGKDWDVYAGPGIHFRKWYREDKLNAPKSYFDVVVQYRFAVTSNSSDMLYVVLSNSF